jgi:DNA repair protein RecN (Recombination protein N)
MLNLLIIKNLLLIESAKVEFKHGLNTLSGESGVVKWVVLYCVVFVLGWKNLTDFLING